MKQQWLNLQLLFVAVLLVKNVKSDGLENFVRAKMANYSTWLQANNLDPSPLLTGPNRYRTSNGVFLDVYLRNHGFEGHSGEIRIDTVETNLDEGWFRVEFTVTSSSTFYGEYSSNGTIALKPLDGAGAWNIPVWAIHTDNFTIKFYEAPSGYLNVSGQILENMRINGDYKQVYFENLLEHQSAAGYEEIIKVALYEGFRQYLFFDQGNYEYPFQTLFLQYWQQVLQETTMTDIVGATMPPPTTTPDPCQQQNENVINEQFAYLGNGKVSVESVETETKLDSDGVSKIITRTVILTEEKQELRRVNKAQWRGVQK